MAKGSGGTRTKNSSTAHGGGDDIASKQLKVLTSIVSKAGISIDAVKTDGIRYEAIGESKKLLDGGIYQQQVQRRDNTEIRISTDNSVKSHTLIIIPKDNGRYIINEGGSRPGKADIGTYYTKQQVISILKNWKSYYPRYMIK